MARFLTDIRYSPAAAKARVFIGTGARPHGPAVEMRPAANPLALAWRSTP